MKNLTLNNAKTAGEVEAVLESPKHCSRCRKTKKARAFPVTKCRGRLTVRSWCDDCMKRYYRDYVKAKKRQK
jgi:hypothetical protein